MYLIKDTIHNSEGEYDKGEEEKGQLPAGLEPMYPRLFRLALLFQPFTIYPHSVYTSFPSVPFKVTENNTILCRRFSSKGREAAGTEPVT